jgi:Tol biopolymer transport system component/imidazolonepropionase-like amidohydrolase
MRPVSCCAFLLLGACALTTDDTETLVIDTNEGTTLAFDLAAGDSTIVFDLLGQLWSMPAAGGAARALTDAVRDTAEDLDPSFSPDGRKVVFRAERHGRTGIWQLDLAGDSVRQLTQVGNPDEYHGGASWSPDGRTIAFTRVAPDTSTGEWRSRIALLDVGTGSIRDLRIDATPPLEARDPAWSPDGRRIAFVTTRPANRQGGRMWVVDANGGAAAPLWQDTMPVIAPAFSPDGGRVAFLAVDTAARLQVWVKDLTAQAARSERLTHHDDVAATRVRWTHAGDALVYAADGKLHRIDARGGKPVVVPFTARLAITRTKPRLPQARLPEPGTTVPAHALLGLALAPDGQRIAALALGRLWLMPLDGAARAIADVPLTARGLAWSPDGNEVAWSDGVFGAEDLFAASVRTGVTRRLTALPGREALPAYSPDGRWVAFVHQAEGGALRVIAAQADEPIADTIRARTLGPARVPWMRTIDTYPQWSPGSDAVLVVGDFEVAKPTTAMLFHLSGARDTITQFAEAPIFPWWGADGSLTYVRHDRLWRVPFDGRGVQSPPQPLGMDAALYAAAARDGSVLYISADGLRVRTAAGAVRTIGWPITYTVPVPPPLLVQNARVIDGKGTAASEPRDLLVERGLITRIAPGGTLRRPAADSARVIDAAGKFVMPGLVDLHAHIYRPDLLPGFLYFGITMLRDQGSPMAVLAAYADGIAAGMIAGPRLTYGGFQFYSDWPFDDEQGRGIEPEGDPQHVRRAVALADAFGAQHVKTRTFRRWDINARTIEEAHRRGMRATGHCAAQLPLIAAGVDAKEHSGLCSTRGAASPYALNDVPAYDDIVQLYRASRVAVVPTIAYFGFAARVSEELLAADGELTPFITTEEFEWMLDMNPAERARTARAARAARAATGRLARAGVVIGTGSDLWQLPTGVHLELEELVAAGLSPAEAIRAATSWAASIIGAERVLGSVEVGKWADLVILDADPVADIRNTRRIAAVIQNGRIIDRGALREAVNRKRERKPE